MGIFYLSTSTSSYFFLVRHTFYIALGIIFIPFCKFINYTSRFHYSLPLCLDELVKNKHLINLFQLMWKKKILSFFFLFLFPIAMACRFSYLEDLRSEFFMFYFHSCVFVCGGIYKKLHKDFFQ